MRTLILGASGHARVIIDLVERGGLHQIVGLLAEESHADGMFCGYPVLGSIRALVSIYAAHKIAGLIAGVGDNWRRSEVVRRARDICPDCRFVSASHPSAQIGRDVALGEGTVVMAGAVVNSGTRIGHHCIVNTGACVDHDCVLGDYSSVAPGATLGGNVHVGCGSAISLGAGVIHGITIGDDTIVGAGATVLRDIPASVVAYGTPARVVRTRTRGERYLTGRGLTGLD